MSRRDTSSQAWFLVQPKLGPLQKKCLSYIENFPDKTDVELGQISGLGENFRKRRSELEDKGVIQSSGKRICTVTHNERHTWRAVK
jgi:hypothetical protein